MQTLYIDVYFFINYTVDLLAFYLSLRLSRVEGSVRRLMLSALIGALHAVAAVLLPVGRLLLLLLGALTLLLTIRVLGGRIGWRRRVRLGAAFLIFETLIGGAVYFGRQLLGDWLTQLGAGVGMGVENRRLLLLSVLVLLTVGVLKLVLAFFSPHMGEEHVLLEISYGGATLRTEALIDSGNRARDPMDSRPVVLLKSTEAARAFPALCVESGAWVSLPTEDRRRIRMIPVSFGRDHRLLLGFRPDEVRVYHGNIEERIAATVAIDRERGSYGGYAALMPYAAVEDIV